MKLQGKQISRPKPRTFKIYRVPEPLEFTVQAVIDFSEFEELCPEPKPPSVAKPGKKPYLDYEDGGYQKKMSKYGERRTQYVLWKSLMATEGLEFDKIKFEDPETWDLREELKDDFTPYEISEIITKIMEINAPSHDSYKEAMENFTPGPSEEKSTQSPTDDQASSQSGKPAND